MRARQTPPIVDKPLFAVLLTLCGLSLMTLYSAGGEQVDLLVRQGARIGFALALLLLCARLPITTWMRWSPHLYALGVLLLLVVLVAGITGKGAQRWLDFGLFHFQPAEMMKLAVPMMVAWSLTRRSLPPRPLALLLALLVILAPAALVVVQPDLGTAILIAVAGLLVIFLAGIHWQLIVAVCIVLSATAPVMWSVVLQDYQRSRIVTLFDPWSDPLGTGYHTIQSIIAVGSGGLHGKGWLAGTQSRLAFIPERSTDFIFAIYAEEFGFLGALLLLSMYLFLGYRGLLISFRARTSYARLLGGCLSITLFCYVFVNIGMVVGILPVVGVPLPLLSYGGSSMVALMVGFGILMSIHRHTNTISVPVR